MVVRNLPIFSVSFWLQRNKDQFRLSKASSAHLTHPIPFANCIVSKKKIKINNRRELCLRLLNPCPHLTDIENSFNAVSLQYDQYTGRLLKTSTFKDKKNGEKIEYLNYDIHVGRILGLPGKILAFFASLVSASLPITGFYIWWGRRKKKLKKMHLLRKSLYSKGYRL